jgi:hypothetical protein
MDLRDITYAHSKFGTEHSPFIHTEAELPFEAHCGIKGSNMTLTNISHATSVQVHCRWIHLNYTYYTLS